MNRLLKYLLSLALICFVFIYGGHLFAQIGGPYQPDNNTMLLLHFDGNLTNASNYSADGVFNGDASNFYFLPNSIPGLNQCLRIDNDSQTDKAFITVADTQYLDLTGDWTIEGWINIFTFGEGSSDWRWVPRLVIKTGDEVFWQPNYFVEMWGSTRFFSCGYNAASKDQWPQANSRDNTMVPGQWYHMAFIRDTSRHLLMTIIHNAKQELVSFSVVDYLSFGAVDPTPITTNRPLHIGYAGGGEDSYLDGFVDEIRISNVVREFPIPPIISNVTALSNQEASVPGYKVGANIYTLFSGTIASAKLFYNTGQGLQSVNMQTVAGDSMVGTIPQQPLGTIIKYYIEAIDNKGLKFVAPKDVGFNAADNYSFGVYSPRTQTLALNFEEGSGTPKDISPYKNPITVVGAPTYWPGAPEGSNCLYLEGDSSYLEVDTPFLTAEEFCVDFWFNADVIENYCRILNRPSAAGSWSTNNYQIRFDNALHLQAISDGSVTITTDVTVETGKWYHVIYEVQKASTADSVNYYAAFWLGDQNNNQLFMGYAGFDVKPMAATAPLRIGKAAGGTYPPYFQGFYDDIKIFNHASKGLLNRIFYPEPIGGPYTADDKTMLLLHFDGNLKNESKFSADGKFNGDASNFFFLPNSVKDLNQCLRIDNDSQTDKAYITVPDTAALDLTGDWTIEGWINIFTFGEGASDWRWVPRLVIKTGDEVFWRPNYFVEMWGNNRLFSCGYQTASQDAWPQANSRDNTMVPGQWYHMSFIRDTNRHILMTIIHNAKRELVSFAVADYLGFGALDPTPIVTKQPLHIGYAGGGEDSFLDGFVDEIRISNSVRPIPIPPIISNVAKLTNQEATVPGYTIGANIYSLFSGAIGSARLYFDTGTGWQSVNMQSVGGDSMIGTIPQQPLGTIIRYYLEAVDNTGLSFIYPKDAGWEAADYYSFGVYSPRTQTLKLDFEEGAGKPVDGSPYKNPITIVGKPAFMPGAPAGNYCLYLEGDSSYLEVDSPFLTAEEFSVDFWFNADTLRDYCRILNRPSDPAQWASNNYQIRFDNAKHLQAISDGTGLNITTNFTVEVGKWYHVIYEVMKALPGDTVNYYGGFWVGDANNNKLFMGYAGFNTKPLVAGAPLRIGKAAGGTYPPYFKGYYDQISIANYPATGLLNEIVSVDDIAVAPKEFTLAQNYPNPFNPSTEITYTVPSTQNVTLVVYNLLGEKVRTLVDKVQMPGRHQVTWDGKNDFGRPVATGMYFYRLESKEVTLVRKMMFLK